jgi:putative addiction module component (TIGR02574 family)
MGIDPADLVALSLEEKLDLISELWDSIESSPAMPNLSAAQSSELARRRADGLREPAAMVDWSVVRDDLRRKS